jgi:hypothetical protein
MNIGRTTYPTKYAPSSNGFPVVEQDFREEIMSDAPIERVKMFFEIIHNIFGHYAFNPYLGDRSGVKLFPCPVRVTPNAGIDYVPMDAIEKVFDYLIDNAYPHVAQRLKDDPLPERYFRPDMSYDEDSSTLTLTLIGARMETDAEYETRKAWIESRRESRRKQQAQEALHQENRKQARVERERKEYERLKKKFGDEQK